jgi:signal transduction histidine kinase/CheY-like chemotaxis protein
MTATDRIRSEQIKAIYRNTPPGMAATLVAVSVLTAVLVYIDAVALDKASWFIAAMCIQSGSRMLLHRAYLQVLPVDQDWRRWALWFTVGTLVGGVIVGGGSVWIMSGGRTDLQLIVLLLIFACVSGAATAFGMYLPAFYVFLFSISMAPVIWLLWQSDTLHVALAGLYALWFAAVIEQARRANLSFIDSIRLRFENVDLVESLRREKAAAELANTAKSRFLAAASHDLRQPVHALSLFVAAMRPRQMDDEARSLLDHVDGSVRAMSGLFGGLLDISRLDAGVVEINRMPFAIQPLIDRVCRDYSSEAAAKSVYLSVRRSSAVVQSDPLLLERILRNLIGNAVSYTERGKILVGCRRGAMLRIQVCDTGPGIPMHEHEHIFQEFYQLDNPERDRTKGVGLGLAIVKRLTALLDHSLTLRSTVNRGSVFTIEVPLAAAGVDVVSTDEDASSTEIIRGSGLILVIDDEVAIQVAMRSLLHSWGYDSIITATCDDMLKQIALRREVPKLIVCDYRLREHENGIVAIERLRSEYNDDIPGMLITGDTAPDRLKEAQDSGFLLLHKPVPNSKLRAAITHLMDVSKQEF